MISSLTCIACFLTMTLSTTGGATDQEATEGRWRFSISQLPWKVVIRDNDDPLGLIVRTEFMGNVKFVEGDEFRIDVESVGFENSTRRLKDVVDYSFLAFDSPDGLTMMLQVFESSAMASQSGGLWYKLGISLGMLLASILIAALMLVYMYRTVRKQDKANAYNKNHKYALADDVKDYIINKFGVYLARRARTYSARLSKKADKLEAIWKRASNYSRSSRLMKPSDVKARQAALVAQNQTSVQASGDAGMDPTLYGEPIYEEAEDEPRETIIDRYGVHLLQEAKSYTEGFSNTAERLEAVWNTKRASMYSRLSSNEGDSKPVVVSADVHTTQDNGTDSEEEVPRGTLIDRYGVEIIRTARNYSNSLTRKADRLEEMWKRASYPASAVASDVGSDVEPPYSSEFFLNRTAGVGAESDNLSDADANATRETIVDDTGVHLVKRTNFRKASRRTYDIKRTLKRISYPTYGSRSSSLKTENRKRKKKEKRQKSKLTAASSKQRSDDETDDYRNGNLDDNEDEDNDDDDQRPDDVETVRSNECLLNNDDKQLGMERERLYKAENEKDGRESATECEKERDDAAAHQQQQQPEEACISEEKAGVKVSEDQGRIAMEDSLTGSFTNSGYDSDSSGSMVAYSAPPSPDVSPCVIMNQMSDALSKPGADQPYERQVSTPSPDRSPQAIRHQMEALFDDRSPPDSDDGYAIPDEVGAVGRDTSSEGDYYNRDAEAKSRTNPSPPPQEQLADVNSNPVDDDILDMPPPPPNPLSPEEIYGTDDPDGVTVNNNSIVCKGHCRSPSRNKSELANNNPGDSGSAPTVLPCGPNCIHSRMTPTPKQSQAGRYLPDKTPDLNRNCTGQTCTPTQPCGVHCVHNHGGTNRLPVTTTPHRCHGAQHAVAPHCGQHAVRQLVPAGSASHVNQRDLCMMRRCTTAVPCGVHCIHVARKRGATAVPPHGVVLVGPGCTPTGANPSQRAKVLLPKVTSPTKLHPTHKHQIVLTPQNKHTKRAGVAPSKKAKATTPLAKVVPGQTVTIKVPPKVVPPPSVPDTSGSDDVKLPSRKKGGWKRRGKRLDLTALTVLSIMCVVLPVIHARLSKDLKVDITIHIPKGFIKPGIQVFFNTKTGGKVDVEDWTYPLNVSSYDIGSIRVDLATAEAANCTSSPCHHACDGATGTCVCRRGFVLQDSTHCEACSLSCPYGSYQDSPCNDDEEKSCVECTASCPDGMFISKPCDQFSDIECTECSKPCNSSEYESVPCAGTTNRECQAIDAIPPVITSDNIMVEDLKHVRSQDKELFDINDGDQFLGKPITFDRGSGYVINVTISAINLRPLYESVDHSTGNDLAYAPELHRKLCDYPVPKYYTIAVHLYQNITTLTKESTGGVYSRSATEPCTTNYGYTAGSPPPEYNSNVLACAEPTSLSELFKRTQHLETYTSFRVDKTQRCFNMNKTCAQCSDRCAKSFDATEKTNVYCRLPASRAEVLREGSDVVAARMKECFKCCMLGNCSVCLDYQQQCHDQIRCRTGNILVYTLTPYYSPDTVYCHVQPKQGSVIYRLQYRVLYEGELVKNRTFVAERVVDGKHPVSSVAGFKRHDFLVVRHGTGVSKVIHMIRGKDNFEAGELELGNRLLPTTGRRLKVHPTTAFGINTKTWKHRSCSLNVNRTLRNAEPSWTQVPDVEVTRNARGYLIQNRTVAPHFQVLLPRHLSVLQAFYGSTKLKNDRTLRAELLRNGSFWIVKISGEIEPCPGLINVQIRAPEFHDVTLFNYDVGVDCPPNFDLEFHLPTGGADVHEKRLALELRDGDRVINVTLFRPVNINKYHFGNPRPFRFDVRGFLVNLSPFIIGTVALLVALVAILAYGYATRPDPLHRGRDNRLHRRHLLFVVWFIVFKFVYSLLVSVTEFVLIARAIHSSTFNVLDQYPDYHHLVAHYEQIELNKIRSHLAGELQRQEEAGAAAKRVCEVQLYAMHRQVQDARENLLKLYFESIQGFDIGSLAFEKIRHTVEEYADRLRDFQEDFERFTKLKTRQLMADMRQVYYDIKNNNWLAGARIIHLTVNGLCFGCLEPFMKWVGLEFDFQKIEVPDLKADFPQPNLTLFSKPSLGEPMIPELPPMEFNPIAVQNLSTDIHNIVVDPERYKKYVPKAEFNFFLNSLRQNALIIFLVIIDSLWFAFRCTRTYARVIQLLHGFNYEIDLADEEKKPKDNEEDTRSRGERARAAIKSGLFKLLDILLDICIRIFALLKNLYYRVMNTDLVPQMLLIIFLILTFYLLIIITENMLDVDTLWNLGYFHLKVAPIIMSRKVANTRITANAFKINNMEYKFYETLVNMRLKQYRILLKTYNRLMCERTSFQAVEYCAWWNELYPDEPCVPPVVKPIRINFTTCDLPPIEPITYTDFDSLAYRLELKRSMKPYVAAMQRMILDSFVALGIMVAVFVLIGALGQAIMALLKRFDLVRLLKVYNNTKDPSIRKEFLPACLDEDKNANKEKKPIGAVKINTELFGERTHTAPTVFVQSKTLIR